MMVPGGGVIQRFKTCIPHVTRAWKNRTKKLPRLSCCLDSFSFSTAPGRFAPGPKFAWTFTESGISLSIGNRAGSFGYLAGSFRFNSSLTRSLLTFGTNLGRTICCSAKLKKLKLRRHNVKTLDPGYSNNVQICNGWCVCMNGATSVPMSVLRVVDKVKLCEAVDCDNFCEIRLMNFWLES